MWSWRIALIKYLQTKKVLLVKIEFQRIWRARRVTRIAESNCGKRLEIDDSKVTQPRNSSSRCQHYAIPLTNCEKRMTKARQGKLLIVDETFDTFKLRIGIGTNVSSDIGDAILRSFSWRLMMSAIPRIYVCWHKARAVIMLFYRRTVWCSSINRSNAQNVTNKQNSATARSSQHCKNRHSILVLISSASDSPWYIVLFLSGHSTYPWRWTWSFRASALRTCLGNSVNKKVLFLVNIYSGTSFTKSVNL